MDRRAVLNRVRGSLEREFDVDSVYLFGSRATGVYTEDSDYDIAVVSDDFEELSFLERQERVRPLVRDVLGPVPIDVACYTEAEYEDGKEAGLPYFIEREGVEA